ncbi:hypothetical protein TBLA_0C04750 [Henningerozyma blattae CBS 6284]|uniref:Uncharacterized protein n=1 Tax=Henningerozyma blattae (strain ATCC 34711 / CBS 6284 / DSM 70876 / NBRC 10599 / NRRL Y-10934 / UCD 77-7) TaxID=1071380 RepID=I2H1L9_HENB6|nr:hypothetical protein TBLA_0C04750 [Tetrapisispora blattae CBS 6284]CCH60271.1 hypothetical protein TBLA_0C04750 [Tetrapisispora blattae CBS 6284]
MSSDALKEVANLIKDDISLDRIKDIKDQLTKKKSTLDYQLNKESDKYYGYVKESVEKLNASQESVKSIRERLDDVNKLSNEHKSSIERYDIILKATKIYETIDLTSTIYSKIIKFDELLGEIDQMLTIESESDSAETGCPYLLQIHYLLTKSRDFQDQMIAMAAISTDDVQRTVGKIFTKLDILVSKFDGLLERLIYDAIELVRAEQISLVIKLFKIIDLEEREDLKIMAIRNIIKKKEIEVNKSSMKKLPSSKIKKSNPQLNFDDNIEYPTNNGIYKEILSGTITTRTNVRNYKLFFFEKIASSIADIFKEVRKEYSGDRKFEVLENLDWVFNELLVVKEYLTKYGPSYWKLFEKYYGLYYEQMNQLINDLVESEPETIIILDILEYDKSYQQTMVTDFGFKKKEVKSIIGDKQKEQLFSDYLKLILTKMQEWITNLVRAEFDVFMERSTPPHQDSEGLFYLDGTKTCFQMFSQQVEVAGGSGQAKILVGVVDKFCGLLKDRQQLWIEKISEEVKKLIQFNQKYDLNPEEITSQDEVPAGLVEYLTAIANDQMRSADYAVAISSKYGKIVSKVYEKQITNHIEATLDGFAEVARCGSVGIISIIFDDLKKPYKEVFSKSWYTGNEAQQIADTLYEYLNEIKLQMNSFVFSTLLETVVEETILKFIGALGYNHSFKNKGNKFLESVKRDFEIFYKLFIQFVPEGEDKTIIIDEKFKLMEFFMDLSCGPVDEIANTWEKTLQIYWDCPIILLEAILSCRKDVDNSRTKQILGNASQLNNNSQRLAHVESGELQPTFISRLVLAKKEKK